MGKYDYQMGLGQSAGPMPFQDTAQPRFNPTLGPPQRPGDNGGASPYPNMPLTQPRFNPTLGPPQQGGEGGLPGLGGMTGNPWGPMQPTAQPINGGSTLPYQLPPGGGLGLGALGPMPGQDYGSAFRWGGNNGLAQALGGMNPSRPASGFGGSGRGYSNPAMPYLNGQPGQMQPMRGMGPTLGQMNNFTNRRGRYAAY